MKRLLSIILVISILLGSGIAFAAKGSPDYLVGLKAGSDMGKKKSGSNVSIIDAWLEHTDTKAYQDYVFNDSVDGPNDYYIGFEDGFRDNYKPKDEDEDKDKEIKTNFADSLGKTLGSIYGTRDFQGGKRSNWERALPNDRTLRKMFNLDLEDSGYRTAFLSEFRESFMEGYKDAYEKAMLDPIKTTLEQGIIDGSEMGGLLGSTFGAKDYYEKRDNDYTRNIPSERDIIADYSLNDDKEEYKNGFLSGFLRAYETEYNKAFREANINEFIRDEKDAYNHGKEVGNKAGQMSAVSDYIQQKVNNWKNSIPKEDIIINEYNLKLQSQNYRDGFVSGYYDGYSEGYNEMFKEFSQGSAMGKSNSSMIPIAGESLYSLDYAMMVDIESGTYYHPVMLNINTLYNLPGLTTGALIKASDSYVINLLNTSGNVDNTKPVKLAFEYYSDKIKGGIYKFVEGKWIYLPSVIEDGVIATEITPSLVNGTYSVFVDTNALFFSDSRGHWAKDEINTYVRRNIIYGYTDGTFKPDKNISRAEFLTILSRTYNWNVDFFYFGSASNFKDFDQFGARANIINYATAMGYISGYPDGTFRPNDPISYKEVEIIMSRVQSNAYFKWSDISTKMLHEKKVKSSSISDMNNKITRAEVIYMLYELNKGKF